MRWLCLSKHKQIIQLRGDHGKKKTIEKFILTEKLASKDEIRFHGYDDM